RADLTDDIRTALDAEPVAGAFFDGLAQFYRQAFLRWINATKRRPDERARRIAEMIDLLGQGQKQRP
ncbi:MAG TPA: YdeI/OmpD-associated family protein, partial [Ilumatobacteraceae bacterium]|nr:YdeI/OmpD-associated family protein [Ilumatobacteraceae bacterium]